MQPSLLLIFRRFTCLLQRKKNVFSRIFNFVYLSLLMKGKIFMSWMILSSAARIRRATITVHWFVYLFILLSLASQGFPGTFCFKTQINFLFTILLESERLWLPECTVSPFCLCKRELLTASTYKLLYMRSLYSTYSSSWHGVIRGVSVPQHFEY